jgi:chaperonin GroEL
MQFDNGYIFLYFVTDTSRMEAEYANPYILVTDRKISSVQEILPVVEAVNKSGKSGLVAIAENVDNQALASLVVNKLQGNAHADALGLPA